MKLALDAPVGTDTLAGTVTLGSLDETVTLSPGDGAGPLKLIEQVEEPKLAMVPGEQVRPVTVICWVMVIVPPFAKRGVLVPLACTAIAPETWMGTLVSGALEAIVTATFPSVPAGIAVPLSP